MSESNEAQPVEQPSILRKRVPLWLVFALMILAVALLLWMIMPVVTHRGHNDTLLRSSSNLKQIGLALQNYDSVNEGLPPRAINGKNGKPQLSWRVAILQFLEEGDLYSQFMPDEPWDSPHNKALIKKIPRVYWDPMATAKAEQGLTNYKILSGSHTAFTQPVTLNGKTLRIPLTFADLANSPRGASNVILVVETGDPVIWTKPDDIDYDPDLPLPAFKPIYKRGILALKADGSVMTVPTFTKESTWRAYIEPNSTSKETLDD